MNYIQDEIKRGNQFAEEVLGKFSDNYAFKHLHIRQTKFIMDILDTLNVHCLLEIGCGIGDFLAIASEKYEKVYGIDPSPKSVEIAKSIAPKADTRTALGEELPFESDFVDVIIMKGVVHHLKDPVLVFKEAQRCLKKGGTIIIIEGNKSSIYRNFILWLADRLGVNHELSLFEHRDPKTMTNMLEECGLEVGRPMYISGLFTPVSHAGLGNKYVWKICDMIENVLQKTFPILFSYHVILKGTK